MVDWIWSQNCRNKLLLHTVGQLVRSSKLNAMCISNQRSDIDWTEQSQIVKARVFFRGLLSKILRRLNQFHEIQTGGWSREVLNVVKTKPIRRLELNTSDNFMNLRAKDFFVR